MKKFMLAAVFTLAFNANAGIIPVGVQNDVAISQVTNDWGWTLCYQDTYKSHASISSLFASCTGDYIMLASEFKGSGVLDVMAAALYNDVTTYTSYNSTHLANGVNWYFNGLSMGFVGLGATINQLHADINNSVGSDKPDRARLSWHTAGGYQFKPKEIASGGRSGSNGNGANGYLRNSTDWQRLVFTANASPVAPTAVPAPATLAIFGLGLLLLSGFRRNKI